MSKQDSNNYSGPGSSISNQEPHHPYLVESDETSRRSTLYGDVIGYSGASNHHAWLGIPYAAPPVGEARWRAPRAPARWESAYMALTRKEPSCQRNPSVDSVKAGHLGSEDCLYLNIWSPRFDFNTIPTNSDRVPVIVWVHGGSNTSGEGSKYDGGIWAAKKNVIVVTLNYRLGVFGWFRHAALRGPGTTMEDQSGNFGTLDIIFALQWIRDNISAFGGNPLNVTICGHSQGGVNVYSLLAAPPAKGLFHRAIIQSGFPATTSICAAENYLDEPNPGDAQSSAELLLRLIVNDELATDRATAKAYLKKLDDKAVANYLLSKTYQDFDSAYQSIARDQEDPSFRPGFPYPFADGQVVLKADTPSDLLDSWGYHPIPIMIGSTRSEYTLLLLIFSSAFTENTDDQAMVKIRNHERFYLAAEYLSLLDRAKGVDEPAQTLSRQHPGMVFAYRFDWDHLSPMKEAGQLSLGATHGLDVPFVFGHLNFGKEFFFLPLLKSDSEFSFSSLSDAMMSYWTRFAQTGDPGFGNRDSLPLWKPWNCGDGAEKFILLNDPASDGLKMSSAMVTRDQVLSHLEKDDRFKGKIDRFEFLRDLMPIASHFKLLSRADYAEFAGGECAIIFPIDR